MTAETTQPAAGVGSLAGGWWSGRLIKRGATPAAGRLRVMLVCACLMPLSALVAGVASTQVALALACVAVVASLAFLINISSLVVDLVPRHSLGTVFSVVAAGSSHAFSHLSQDGREMRRATLQIAGPPSFTVVIAQTTATAAMVRFRLPTAIPLAPHPVETEMINRQ